MPLYATVVPDKAGDKALDYIIPAQWEGRVVPGSRVWVPLRSRKILGMVVSVSDQSSVRGLREIIDLLGEEPLIGPEMLELARWLAEYYCCPIEAAMACVLPQAVRSGEVTKKKRNHVRLVRQPTSEELAHLSRRAPRQADVLKALQASDSFRPVAEVAAEVSVAESVFKALEKAGFVEIKSLDVARDPYGGEKFLPTQDLELNPEQSAALAAVSRAMDNPATAKPILLHGVTGSGKTEVYLQSIRRALERGKTALVLVPEISLTPQTVERFKARFADRQDQIAVLHSHLSGGERYDEWYKIHSGEACIVIGARSAVFAPLRNLGVLIVDEEHETSYKQEEAPRYNARDVAVLRASRECCPVVLGSATPSLESWQNTQLGKYELVRMNLRVDDRRMPLIRVLDMRLTGKGGGDGIISPLLGNAIGERLGRGEQVILFLNRRGFSTSMQCSVCGHVCECPNCSVALTYHRDAGILACHICGHNERAPRKCPGCSDEGIRHVGVGTQKVEEAIRKIFPKARVARMDADSMSRKDSYKIALGAFRMGQTDILVGTQMIAKGLDFPNVTLVGIINADMGLHVPDFRAGERTFQLLTQVAGRAGRGELEGEVLVQTYTPFSPSIQFARHHDFGGFAEQELEFRRSFGFPPFQRMVLITLRSQSRERAEFSMQTVVRRLKERLPAGAVCGEAAPAPLEKAKGFFRFQASLRGPSGRALSRCVREVMLALPLPEDVLSAVDVDPVNLL